jgi:uncharacterized small protein (DUF1192 family)
MSKINLTPKEEKELLQILERYLPDLEERLAIMRDLIKRLKA